MFSFDFVSLLHVFSRLFVKSTTGLLGKVNVWKHDQRIGLCVFILSGHNLYGLLTSMTLKIHRVQILN